ncbi:MAG: PDZ domain-containing protein [Acidobacteria bacterium]|nr:PDZ domain-containing protein [Acidobacteriota bacterium]
MRLVTTLALLALLGAPGAHAIDIADTRLLSEPAVSTDHLAFAYANDLWVADLDGSGVRRLTSHPGVESGPRFSPDGTLVAFTGRYEGNTDVYVISAAGGEPRRLTWHPGPDLVLGFTPDGRAVLFSSPRTVHTRRYTQLFTVPVEGGAPTRLPIPHASKAAISPDGSTIAYLPLGERFLQWKHYRGGTASRILLFDTATREVEVVPQPAGRCNDTDPMWIDGRLFFRSDRDGEFNVYAFDRATRAIAPLTAHDDFPVLSASAGGGRIAYEQAGLLHLLDPSTGSATPLKVGVAADLVERRPRWAKGAKWIRGASLSPSGARVALEFRGEIVTVPREKGDDRNLTRSPGAHERSPAWSPDGEWIAYLSDASGEYALHLAAPDGRDEVRELPLDGPGFYADLVWSPDSTMISFVDNSRTVWILDVATGKQTRVDGDVVYGPLRSLQDARAWSPDSRWLAYTRNTPTFRNELLLYSVADGTSQQVGDGLADVTHPVFDASGQYLYFLVSTDAGPVNDWFSQSSADMRSVQQIYLAVLGKGVPSPLARQSDEEEGPGEDEEETEKEDGEEDAEPVVVRFDPEGLAERVLALPVKAGVYADLAAGTAGQLFYRRGASTDDEAAFAVYRYDLDKRKEEELLDKADGFSLSADKKRALLRVGEAWHVVDVGEEPELDLDEFELDVERVQVKVDPPAEWAQIFDEAWRINRDFFYDPGYHGADWPAMRERYVTFLPHLATRNDLFRVIRWMLSELAVGHSYQGNGDIWWEPETVPGGLLGADYEVADGRYRFAKVYGGLNWNPDLRSPLTEPGVDVKPGEYLLAVEGRELRPPDNLYRRFERTADRIVEITVGPNADGTGSRTVKVVPVEDEADLRNRDWVEGNLRKVTEATGGRVAYVYVPNTAGMGHTYFKRYFFPQAHREAIIVDERYNAGGSVADYYIDILRRPVISYWATRYGADFKTPIAGIHGPKVMIIDETAGSGGDLLPWMFRKFELGTLVGRRTWGGLVGVLGFPVLMDGGIVTAPNLAIWTPEEGFTVENEGVPPDVEVEQTPKDVIAGRDPQLEKAIEIVMEQIGPEPRADPERPPYPRTARP